VLLAKAIYVVLVKLVVLTEELAITYILALKDSASVFVAFLLEFFSALDWIQFFATRSSSTSTETLSLD